VRANGECAGRREIDHCVLAARPEAASLDLDPARSFDDSDLVVVVLAVAAVVVGDAPHERFERDRRPLAPGERQRGGEARVIGLREDDRSPA
jgi:hypothetical protein